MEDTQKDAIIAHLMAENRRKQDRLDVLEPRPKAVDWDQLQVWGKLAARVAATKEPEPEPVYFRSVFSGRPDESLRVYCRATLDLPDRTAALIELTQTYFRE